MPDVQRQALSGANNLAVLRRAALANSVIKLFKAGFLPDPTTPIGDFDANECTFTDYVAKTIVAWNAPTLGDLSGYRIFAPLQQWIIVTDPVVVGEEVGGYWVELAAGTLIDFVIFETPIPMSYVGQQVTVVPTEFFPTG